METISKKDMVAISTKDMKPEGATHHTQFAVGVANLTALVHHFNRKWYCENASG
jgi:hypothetical protein